MTTNGDAPNRAGLFAQLNEQAKRLDHVKVDVVTVLVFLAGLAVLTGLATGIGYAMHKAAKSFERPLRH